MRPKSNPFTPVFKELRKGAGRAVRLITRDPYLNPIPGDTVRVCQEVDGRNVLRTRQVIAIGVDSVTWHDGTREPSVTWTLSKWREWCAKNYPAILAVGRPANDSTVADGIVSTRLRTAEVELIDKLAAVYGISRCQWIAKVIHNEIQRFL